MKNLIITIVMALVLPLNAEAQEAKVKIGNGPWQCACDQKGDSCSCEHINEKCKCDSGFNKNIDKDAWSCDCGFLCYCKPCNCKKHYAGNIDIEKELARMEREIAALEGSKKAPSAPAGKHPIWNRTWVEDVSRPGLWYWGWYDFSDHKFHYTRSEYRAALSNFNSIIPYSKTYYYPKGRPQPWGVVYDP